MSEFLTKEEMLQWRRSTEKCTLEEYAAKLGKKLETEKETNDMVDIINRGEDVVQTYVLPPEERSIKVYVRPKEERTAVKPNVKPIELEIVKTEKPKIIDTPKPVKEETVAVKVEPAVKEVKSIQEPVKVSPSETMAVAEENNSNITFRKDLTDREQKVLDYLISNKGKVIFAKDIAELLNLKKDYIYKYIKSLRAKIVENVLVNSDEGGFILKT